MKSNLLQKLTAYQKLVLGFSGGADSTALALWLISEKIPFEAVHFHHHLRKDSADKDAAFCKSFCNVRNIPFTHVDIPVNELSFKQESIESAARRLRMEYWEKKFSQSTSAVLLAHHKDDIAENFFIRSLRGSSSSGLSGLREEKEINGVTYLRPLLSCGKKDIIDFLKAKQANWCEDESNQINLYTRNIIRNKVIPAFKEIAPLEGLYRTVENVTTDALFIENQAQKWLISNELNKDGYLALDKALRPRVLRLYVQKKSGRDFIPGHDALKRIAKELSKKHFENTSIPLGDNVELILSTSGELFIEDSPYSLEWNWKEKNSILLPHGKLFVTDQQNANSETFKKSDLSETLIIRNWQNGDRMVPFSRKKAAKVKDMFTNKKTPHFLRKQLPLLLSDKSIIWIPKVKRAEFGRFKDDDETVTIAYEKF